MNVRKKASKVKGAALLMVLGVMVVLIIMIAGTLAIVASTYNRTVIKYEESQAYYTARSGLEAVWKTLMQDSVHTDDTGVAKTVNASNPSQGLIIQEAIIGKLVDSGTDIKYNCSSSLKALNGSGSPAAADTYLEFSMDLSQLNTLTASEGGVGQGNAIVRIQLLDLKYDDGSGTGIDRNSVSSSTADLSGGSKQAQYIQECSIKIACTVYDSLTGNPVTVSVVLHPYVTERSSGSGTVSTGSSAFDNGKLFGGTVSAGDQDWGNDSEIVGSVFVNGDINAVRSKKIYLKADESMVVNEKFNCNAAQAHLFIYPIEPTVTSNKEHPYVFIRNHMGLSDQSVIGDRTDTTKHWGKVDVICRGMTTSGNDLPKIFGNTYIDGPLKINFGGINFNSPYEPYFMGDMFISDRQEITDYASNQFYNGTDTVDKTDMGIFNPINISADPSNPQWRPYYTVGGVTYFSFKDENHKLLKLINDNHFTGFCSGKIYYYYKDTTNGFEGAWEFEALKKYIEVAANNGGKVNKFNNLTTPDGGEINVGSAGLSNGKLIGTTDNNIKYICQLEGASTFLEGATVSSTTFTLEDSDKNISYKYYMSLPIDATNRTTKDNADALKKSKLVPTLFSEYSEYLLINVPKTYTKAEIASPPAADPNNPDNLWVKGSSVSDTANKKFDFIKSDRTALVSTIVYWNPFIGTSGSTVTQNWKTALGSMANNATYTADQKLDLVSNILNAVYQAGSDGKNYTVVSGQKVMNTPNVYFMPPALACAENKNIIYDNFNSVMNVNKTETEAKGINVYEYTGGNVNIDTSSGDVIAKLKSGSYNDIKVTGDNFAYILMESGTYYFSNSKLVDDFFGSISTGKYVHSGTKTGYTNVKSPRLLIYADDGVDMQFSNNCRISAYIYGPAAKLSLAMTSGGPSNTNLLYNLSGQYKGAEIANVTVDVVGSLFLREIKGANNATSTYIPLDPNNASPGSPTIKWTEIKYSNTDVKTS